MANPVLESFGESPKACVTNSSRPSAKLKGKENPDLPLVCLNYWPPNVALSLCFNHLVLLTFRPIEYCAYHILEIDKHKPYDHWELWGHPSVRSCLERPTSAVHSAARGRDDYDELAEIINMGGREPQEMNSK